jgi:hypothetical protein
MFDILEYTKNFAKIDNKELVRQWNEVFEQMAVHTRMKKPTELLLASRPNEEPHIFAYRLANYRPITYGSMNRALDSITRVLNRIQYNVIAEENVKLYLQKKQFASNGTAYDFYSYFEKIVLKRGIEDPNGFVAWIPTGEGIQDNSKLIEPKPIIFQSSQVYDINEEVVSFISDEKFESYDDQGNKHFGSVYYVFTKNEFYKLYEISKDKRRKMQVELVYQHNIGEIPVIILGGDMNAKGFYESFFAPYNAFGDEAINTFSDWQAIKVTSGFPYTEEFYEECEIVKPNLSSDPISNTEQKYSKKMGFEKFPRTPFNSIIRKIPSNNKSDAEISGERILPVDVPSKRFISPDIEILKYSGESWQLLIEMAEDALHLNLGNNSNQTEQAKAMDKEEHFAMIDKIANNYFNHLVFNSIKFVDCYLNLKSFDTSSVAIITPTAFRIKTEKDMTDELVALKANKVPDVFLSEATNELAMKRFSGNPLSKKIFEVISTIDPLFTKDIAEKTQLLLNGIIDKKMFIRSTMAFSLLNSIAKKVSTQSFVEMETEKILAMFNEIVKPFYPIEEIQIFEDIQPNKIEEDKIEEEEEEGEQE